MERSDKGSSEQYTRLYYALHCVKFGPKADNEDNIITFLWRRSGNFNADFERI